MAAKKSITIWGLIIPLVIWAWIMGFTSSASAETMNYKFYTYMAKLERVLIGDVEDHALSLSIRRAILVFENGETGTHTSITTSDTIKGSGGYSQYSTTTFADGSTIVAKSQGTLGGGTGVGAYTRGERTGEIIKGTGRFEGIKGTVTGRTKYLPLEKGEDGPKGIGEGTFTYTLPSK